MDPGFRTPAPSFNTKIAVMFAVLALKDAPWWHNDKTFNVEGLD